jgi:two-component system, chemotaxis family, CheB/CheR fusion protein
VSSDSSELERMPSPQPEDPCEERKPTACPIVGIGASAGGLEPFMELLKHLPLDTGMGFVLVQHLDPQHESALTQILTRVTSLPVREITNNLGVESNHVYVIPPNTNLAIAQGILKLQPRPQTRTPHRSIDFFFESLAEDQRERAIGVILSGTATDGTLGLEAIKAEGGITFAQDDSARYDSMPRSAVAAGCVDFVLSPQDIAKELGRIAKHPYIAGQTPFAAEDDRTAATQNEDDATPMPPGSYETAPTGARQVRAQAEAAADGKVGGNGFRKILLLLRNHSGVDFSLYKSTTIQRRLTRRVVLNRQNTLEDYANFLRGNTRELDALYSDVLISVTSFFRNPEAFDVLKRNVFPKLLKQRGDDPIRVWVLGCSTGQEAYSIAIAFVESADQAPRIRRLQVFATDLNDTLLEKARQGLYAKSLVQDVSPERLRRFFVEEQGGYRISKPLREMVVFARQNIISDPPFSRMDLISCRNLLIYLQPSLQKKALPAFHYALKPEGYLLLGASESIGSFTELFEPTDKKHKIYSKKAAPPRTFQLPVRKSGGEEHSPEQPRKAETAITIGIGQPEEGLRSELSAQREADRVSVNQFAPPGVLVNEELQILQFRGQTSAYLAPPTGKATFNVLKMAREGLKLPLRAAINKAKKENKTARDENLRVSENGSSRTVNLEVIPLKNLRERCFLILFEDAEKHQRSVASQPPQSAEHPIGDDSAVKNEPHRLAELEFELTETRDYLQSVQEQHEAANEELQASNEEIQSANEELQSINEELETSKEELESANEELTTVNEEMAYRNAELVHLNSDLANIQTSAQLAIVLLRRDLTIRRFSAQAEKQFNLVATDIGRPFSHVRHNLIFERRARRASPSVFPRRWKADRRQADWPKEATGRAPGAEGSPRDLESFIAEVIATVREHQREVRDTEGRWYSLRVRPYFTLDNKVDGAVLVLVEINELKRNEQAVAVERDNAEAIIRMTRDPLVVLSSDLRVHTASDGFYLTFKLQPMDVEGRVIYELCNHQWDIPGLRQLLEELLPSSSFFDNFEVTHEFQGIGRRTMLLNARTLRGSGDEASRILLGIQDVTEVKQFRSAAQENAEKFELLFDQSPLPKWVIEVETLRFIDVNEAAVDHYGYSREEFLGMSVLDIRTPEAGQKLQATLACPPHRPPERDSCQHRKKSGEVIDVELRSSEIRLAGRRAWLTAILDVSERKRTEDVLRRAAEFDEAVMTNMGEGLYTVDAQGLVTTLNPAAEKMLGWKLEELRGRKMHDMTHYKHPDGRPYPAEECAGFQVLRSGKAVTNYDDVFVRKDGTFLDVVYSSAPLKAGDEIAGLVVVFRDVSERKRAEESLREADRRKNEFLAMLAHELRNPLAPIRNALEILRQREESREAVHSASAMMERQIGQMARLVDDLLDVSRISRGKIELRKGPIELASAVNHAVDAARHLVESKSIDLNVSLPQEPVYLNADPIRLAQVVGNLLSNACKFTSKGGRIWLTAELTSKGDQSPEVLIRVQDTGIGIAADQLDRVFDMFVQLDTSLERSVSGLGIGLTLAKNLVELHGGSMEVHSPGAGQGSEFVVRLPILVEAPQLPSPGPASSELNTEPSRRILVVDDNEDSAESLTILLSLAGHETHTAYDGPQAMEAAATFRPDVILLDIGLPKLNGYEVARKIREQPWGQTMVLVALTGWGQEEDRRRSREAGFDHHLTKPVEPLALTKLLARLSLARSAG